MLFVDKVGRFSQPLSILLGNLLVIAAYWGFGVPAMRFFSEYGLFPSPIWLPAGIALVAALRGGIRYLPGIFLGSLGINHFSLGAPLLEALMISATNTFGPWLGAYLTRPAPSPRPPFYTLHEVVAFTLFGVGVHGFITATGGTLAIGMIGFVPVEKLQEIWLTWMLSDAGGALILAPALLLWLECPKPFPAWQEWRKGTVTAIATVALALLFFFGFEGDPTGHLMGLPYLLFLPMLWVTVNHPPRMANTLLIVVTTLAIAATVSHHGVLYTAPSGKPLETLGLLVVSLTLTVLTVGALVSERRLMEEELLQESRKQFAAFMDNLPAAAYIKEPEGRIAFANQKFEATLGNKHVGEITPDFLPPDVAATLVAMDRRALSEGLQQAELTLPIPNGERRTFQFAKFPIPRADGSNLIGGVAFDISDRKRMEDALRESETRYRLLAENSYDVIWTVDLFGKLTYVSPAVERLLGYTVDEAMRLPLAQIVAPESIRAAATESQFLLRTGELQRHSLEFELRRKDGSAVWTDVIVNVLRDDSGKLLGVVGIARDITAMRQNQEALRTRGVAIEAASEAIVITNRQGVIEYVNPAFSAHTGYSAEEVLGQTPALFKSGQHDKDFYRQLWSTILRGDVWNGEITNRRKDGTLYTEATAIAPVKDDGGRITRFVAIKHDITERKRLERQLAHLAHYDELTGLPNRALFFDRLRHAIAQAKRQQTPFALLFADLDGFKAVNDAHGHDTGDALLQAVAERFAGCIRESDTLARMGGDEFTVILSAIAHGEDAGIVADKLLRSLDAPFDINGHSCRISASIGISLYPANGEEVETLLNRADNAMYAIKHSGKGAYRYYGE